MHLEGVVCIFWPHFLCSHSCPNPLQAVCSPHCTTESILAPATCDICIVKVNSSFFVVILFTLSAKYHSIPLQSISFFRFYGATLSWPVFCSTGRSFLDVFAGSSLAQSLNSGIFRIPFASSSTLLANLSNLHDFKSIYIDDSKFHNSTPEFFPKYLTYICNCQMDISTWMSNWNLKFMSQSELLMSSCLLQFFTPLNLSNLRQQLHHSSGSNQTPRYHFNFFINLLSSSNPPASFPYSIPKYLILNRSIYFLLFYCYHPLEGPPICVCVCVLLNIYIYIHNLIHIFTFN